MVIVSAFNGAGDTYTPTLINVFCYWMFQLPLAWWLAFKVNFGPNGVFLAIAVAESAVAAIAILAFRTGRWKTQKV
jgi:Na+-driven multidrug efflux pump